MPKISFLKKLVLKITTIGIPKSAPAEVESKKKSAPKSTADGPCAASNNAKLFVRSEKYSGEANDIAINKARRKHGSTQSRWHRWLNR